MTALTPDGWLQSGALLYRLTDDRRPSNRDEIRITMSDQSHSPESCARRAGELLDRIRRIEALEAELAACRKDAERMDKLAELMFAADFDYGEDGLSVLVFQWPKNVPVGADLRRNVDAAMAAQEKE